MRIFNSNVKSVLLYACETWFTSSSLIQKIQVFINTCLRKILKIWWPNTITNIELHKKCRQKPVETEIKMRKWRWIGHTLRKEPNEICRQALDWNPMGSRKRGRPKSTWKRILMQEVESSGKSWKELKFLARDRDRWKQFTEALCSDRS